MSSFYIRIVCVSHIKQTLSATCAFCIFNDQHSKSPRRKKESSGQGFIPRPQALILLADVTKCQTLCFRLHWSTLALRNPAGTRTLQMFTMNWSTPLPRIPSSIWNTTTLLVSLSFSVRGTWKLRNYKKGRYLLIAPNQNLFNFCVNHLINTKCVLSDILYIS